MRIDTQVIYVTSQVEFDQLVKQGGWIIRPLPMPHGHHSMLASRFCCTECGSPLGGVFFNACQDPHCVRGPNIAGHGKRPKGKKPSPTI